MSKTIMRAGWPPDAMGAPSGDTFSLSAFLCMRHCKGHGANNDYKSTYGVSLP
jgi:hypothetical protein